MPRSALYEARSQQGCQGESEEHAAWSWQVEGGVSGADFLRKILARSTLCGYSSNNMIAIMDFGIGNRAAVARMLERIGVPAIVTADPDALASAAGWLLPGVGAFDAGMDRLDSSGLRSILEGPALGGRPLLGICLGMQLLGRSSEEGSRSGLGLLDFVCRRFDADAASPVPHMRWNALSLVVPTHPLVSGFDADSRAYFVHSYFAQPSDDALTIARTTYGRDFSSVVGKDNVMGVQFHPEKSHRFGMQLLRNFARMCGLTPNSD